MAESGRVDARLVVTGILLTAALLAGVEVVGSAYVPGVDGPCADDGSPRTPAATFEVESDAESNLVVTVRDGATFTRRETVSLLLVVTDGETGERRRINWRQADARVDRESANRTYPVAPGDRVTVESRLLGFAIDEGDAVTVVWRGYELPLPDYCPNRDGSRGSLLEVTLDEGTVGDGSGAAAVRRR